MRFSPKQLQAYKESFENRFIAYVGAVRSGKSFMANLKLAHMARNAPDGALGLFGKSQGSIRRNVVDELEALFGSSYIKYTPSKQELWFFGRQIHCIGASDERATATVKGLTLSGALVDEATELPEFFFKMVDSRLSRPGAQFVFTTNPDSPFHWLKRDFIDRAIESDLKLFEFTLDDNPSLGDDYKNHLKRTYKGLWFNRYILGQWVQADGAVYDFFDEKIHAVENAPSYAKTYLVGVDYGTTNPCAFVLVGINDEATPKIWVEKEYYFDSKERGYQKTDVEYAEDLYRFVEDYPVTHLYIDPSAASFKLELRRKPRPWQIMDASNDVSNGIRTVSTLLSTCDLVVLNKCPNLIGEFQSYIWDAKKAIRGKEEPVKAHDHALDALRYVLHTHFGSKKTITLPTPENAHNARLKAFKDKSGLLPGHPLYDGPWNPQAGRR